MAYDLDLALTAHEKLRSKILKAGAASRHTVPVTVQSLKAELQKMQKLYPAVEVCPSPLVLSLVVCPDPEADVTINRAWRRPLRPLSRAPFRL